MCTEYYVKFCQFLALISENILLGVFTTTNWIIVHWKSGKCFATNKCKIRKISHDVRTLQQHHITTTHAFNTRPREQMQWMVRRDTKRKIFILFRGSVQFVFFLFFVLAGCGPSEMDLCRSATHCPVTIFVRLWRKENANAVSVVCERCGWHELVSETVLICHCWSNKQCKYWHYAFVLLVYTNGCLRI